MERIIVGVNERGIEQRIVVGEDGSIRFIYSDDLAGLLRSDARIERASHVEPGPNGGWLADMSPVGGPVLGADGSTDGRPVASLRPFALRAEALAAEVAWLRQNRGL